MRVDGLSIIWIVEKARMPLPPVAAALLGDFAVQLFGSIESFATLLRLNRDRRPDVIVIDLADVSWAQSRLLDFLAFHFCGTPVVLLADAATDKSSLSSDDRHVLTKPVDALTLSRFVGFVLRQRAGGSRRSLIRYRDVVLDSERHQCLVMPENVPVSLPLKESQILKLFIERPGICLTRDEIREAIWDSVKVGPRTIDSHVSRLRKRLEQTEIHIESVYGGGYVLK